MQESPGPILVRRPLLVNAFERRPGCGQGCSLIYGHDPDTHERAGRARALAEAAARPAGVLETGPLVIDFDAVTVSVGGHPVSLTERQRELLFYLAGHLGHARSHREVAEAVWDPATAELWAVPTGKKHGRWHTVRVSVIRLRGRLREAGPLLETVTAYGYRLRAAPPHERRTDGNGSDPGD